MNKERRLGFIRGVSLGIFVLGASTSGNAQLNVIQLDYERSPIIDMLVIDEGTAAYDHLSVLEKTAKGQPVQEEVKTPVFPLKDFADEGLPYFVKKPVVDIVFSWAGCAYDVDKAFRRMDKVGGSFQPLAVKYPSGMVRCYVVNPCTREKKRVANVQQALETIRSEVMAWRQSNPSRLFRYWDNGGRSLDAVVTMMKTVSSPEKEESAPVTLNVLLWKKEETDQPHGLALCGNLASKGSSRLLLVQLNALRDEEGAFYSSMHAIPETTVVDFTQGNQGLSYSRVTDGFNEAFQSLLAGKYILAVKTRQLIKADTCRFQIASVGSGQAADIVCRRKDPQGDRDQECVRRTAAIDGQVKQGDYQGALKAAGQLSGISEEAGNKAVETIENGWAQQVLMMGGIAPDGQKGDDELRKLLATGILDQQAAAKLQADLSAIRIKTTRKTFTIAIRRQDYKEAVAWFSRIEEASAEEAKACRKELITAWRTTITSLGGSDQVDKAIAEAATLKQFEGKDEVETDVLLVRIFAQSTDKAVKKGDFVQAAAFCREWIKLAGKNKMGTRAEWLNAYAVMAEDLRQRQSKDEAVADVINEFSARFEISSPDDFRTLVGKGWLCGKGLEVFTRRISLISDWQHVESYLSSLDEPECDAIRRLWALTVAGKAETILADWKKANEKVLSLKNYSAGCVSLDRAVQARPWMAMAVAQSQAMGLSAEEFLKVLPAAKRLTDVSHGSVLMNCTDSIFRGKPEVIGENSGQPDIPLAWSFIRRITGLGTQKISSAIWIAEDSKEPTERKTGCWLFSPFDGKTVIAFRLRDMPAEVANVENEDSVKRIVRTRSIEQLVLATLALDMVIQSGLAKDPGPEMSCMARGLQSVYECESNYIANIAVQVASIKGNQRGIAKSFAIPEDPAFAAAGEEYASAPVSYAKDDCPGFEIGRAFGSGDGNDVIKLVRVRFKANRNTDQGVVKLGGS